MLTAPPHFHRLLRIFTGSPALKAGIDPNSSMEYRYIAVEGNIGAGKSTLALMLSAYYGTRLLEEGFADNHLLPKYYKDPERYALQLELSFLAARYKQCKQLLSGDLFQEKVVADYMFTKSKLFARVSLPDEEYYLFEKLFEIIEPQLPVPDLLIYLHAPIGRLQRNIRERGRSYEAQIEDEYLERLQDVYRQYLRQEQQKTLIVDISATDFAGNPDHFRQLTVFLEKDYDYKTHHLMIER